MEKEHNMSAGVLTDQAFDQLFRKAHTANGWNDTQISDKTLEKIYNVMKFGPTSANSSPLRIVFIRTKEGKERLKPTLDQGNVDKTMAAPVTVVFAHDMKFYEHLPALFPQTDAKSWFSGNEKLIAQTAFRNGTLQAAYFMIAARGFGLDCGPMSGFNNEKLDQAFFPDGRFKSNFLCNLGHADPVKTYPRNPRLTFEEACTLL
jgi:3-hydroxypropanoate dehydrogenase